MYRTAKNSRMSIYIISAVLLWMALFCVTAWGAEVPGGGNAVDGTLRDVTADQVSKGSDIANAPSISGSSASFDFEQTGSASSTDSQKSDSTLSPVIVCGKKKTVSTSGPSDAVQPKEEPLFKWTSLGMFATTGYCLCEECSGGFSLTYSGTVPQAQHTVSADITRFPIGTRLMIDGIIYTVEDIGSNVIGDHIDIYYDNHEDAIAHGRQMKEVFTVE